MKFNELNHGDMFCFVQPRYGGTACMKIVSHFEPNKPMANFVFLDGPARGFVGIEYKEDAEVTKL